MSIETPGNIEDYKRFKEADERYAAERKRRYKAEKDEMAEIRKKFEAKSPEEQKAVTERAKSLWRAYEIMSEERYGSDEFQRSTKGYRELFNDPLFRKLPEANGLLEEERGFLESGVSKAEIDKYSGFYGKINRVFDDTRSELIDLPLKLGTYQQHERDVALDEIRRERKALAEKEK